MEHLRSETIDHGESNLGSVLRRIDMNAEGPLSKRRINDLNDGCSDRAHIGVIGYDGCEGFLNLLAITFIWPCLVLGQAASPSANGTLATVVHMVDARFIPAGQPIKSLHHVIDDAQRTERT